MASYLETPKEIISVTEIVNGTIEEYGEWIRNMCLVQNIFKQIVRGYANLLKVGYYHCNISSDTVLLQIQSSSQDPSIPEILAKLSGFEQAVPVSADGGFVKGEMKVCQELPFAAPEVCEMI